jgi:actin-related protein
MVTDRKHLEVYETLWMKKLRSINKIEPSGGLLNHYYKKQWREKNKENIRKYRVDNAEHIRECTKKYKERNAEHIKETTKKWREANVEKRREDLKQWRLVNGDKEKARKREKVECDCGLKTSRCGIARHKRTKRHMELMNAKTQ